jgi:serine/threonine protein kinase
MAPEQQMLGQTSPQSDAFSFGVLLFELLEGQLPFRNMQNYLDLQTAKLSAKNARYQPLLNRLI